MYWNSEILGEIIILLVLLVVGALLTILGSEVCCDIKFFVGLPLAGVSLIFLLIGLSNWSEDSIEYLEIKRDRGYIVTVLEDSEDVNTSLLLLKEDVDEFNDKVSEHNRFIDMPFVRLMYNPQIAELDLIDIEDYKDTKTLVKEDECEDEQVILEEESCNHYCIHCGKRVEDTWSFCKECGNELD